MSTDFPPPSSFQKQQPPTQIKEKSKPQVKSDSNTDIWSQPQEPQHRAGDQQRLHHEPSVAKLLEANQAESPRQKVTGQQLNLKYHHRVEHSTETKQKINSIWTEIMNDIMNWKFFILDEF